MKYFPDRWVIVELTGDKGTHCRVFGTWFGGYLNGDSWRMNSGIKAVRRMGNTGYSVDGESGSIYVIGKDNYGVSGYSSGILAQYEEQSTEDLKFRTLSEPESLRFLDEFKN